MFRGQIDLKQVAIPLVASAIAWFGGTTWSRYGAAEDMRRAVEAHDKALKNLEGLPVEDLKKLPSKVERIELASEGYRKTQDDQTATLAAILKEVKRHR